MAPEPEKPKQQTAASKKNAARAAQRKAKRAAEKTMDGEAGVADAAGALAELTVSGGGKESGGGGEGGNGSGVVDVAKKVRRCRRG